MVIGFIAFLILMLCCIIYECNQRYEYVKETRRVWKRFEKSDTPPFGLSNVYENIEVDVLKKKQNGDRYNNGRKVN